MKKILLLYTFEHSGHHRACLALERAFSAACADAETRTAHAVGLVSPTLARAADETYFFVMRSFPSLWGHLYDRPSVLGAASKARPWLMRRFADRLCAAIDRMAPDAVVCTQALACIFASEYRKRRPLVPLFGVLTDFHANAWWAATSADEYIVASKESCDALAARGIPRARIRALGIPIDPVFAEAPAAAAAASLSGRNVLVMGGARGFISETLVTRLERSERPFALTVLAGKNAGLYERLRRRSGAPSRTEVLPYVENVREHMRRADVVVTKPGGLSVSEALACGKPLVIVGALPGQERHNARILAGSENVFCASDEAEAARRVEELVERGEPAKAGARGTAALEIALRVRETLS